MKDNKAYDPLRADEELACKFLIEYAKDFYAKPENQSAYEDWIKAGKPPLPQNEALFM